MHKLAVSQIKHGKTYATCRECAKVWNVSKSQIIPLNGYVCPYCRGKQKREELAKRISELNFKHILITLVGIALYLIAAEAVKETRGYIAYGGECLLLFLPLWWLLIKEAVKGIEETINE